jgi:biotin carboxylase
VDGPGGPPPSLYWPSLADDLDLWVLSASDEPARARSTRDFPGARGFEPVADPSEIYASTRRVIDAVGSDGVFAVSELVLFAAQRAAYDAGLPANSIRTVEALGDKRLQRRLMRESGLPVPGQRELHDLVQCQEAAASLQFPVVIKPAAGVGGVAVVRVEDPEQLEGQWLRARSMLLNSALATRGEPLLIAEEELVGDPSAKRGGLGDYVAVETLSVEGETRVLAVTDKMPLADPFRECGCLMPSTRPAEEVEAVVAATLEAHRALDIHFGAAHTELKLTVDGPRIIEVNGRPGGGVSEMLAQAASYDYPRALALACVGDDPDIEPRFSRCASRFTPQPPQDLVLVEAGPTVAELQGDRRVETVEFLAKPGDVLDSRTDSSAYCARIVAAAESQAELIDLIGEVNSRFSFRELVSSD